MYCRESRNKKHFKLVFLFRPFPITIQRWSFYPKTVLNAFVVTADAHLLIRLPKNVPNAPEAPRVLFQVFRTRPPE
jgi:hypothetical protein